MVILPEVFELTAGMGNEDVECNSRSMRDIVIGNAIIEALRSAQFEHSPTDTFEQYYRPSLVILPPWHSRGRLTMQFAVTYFVGFIELLKCFVINSENKHRLMKRR